MELISCPYSQRTNADACIWVSKNGKSLEANNQVLITLGTRQVAGVKDYSGIAFLIKGTAQFITNGGRRQSDEREIFVFK